MRFGILTVFDLVFIFILLVSGPLLAEKGEINKKTLFVSRLNQAKPVIDGHLNDGCWKSGRFRSDLIQLRPVEGNSPSEKTEFCINYDENNIYIAVKAFDSRPDSIEALVVRRDDMGVTNSDYIFVMFDSHFDGRTAYEFGINAAGSREDVFFSEDANRMDVNWDPVWEAESSITEYGWCTEMCIPFTALRFSKAENQKWGFNFYRKIYRRNEELHWQLVPDDSPGFVSYSGIIEGFSSIASQSRIELMPFAGGRLNTFKAAAGDPFTDGIDLSSNFGFDGKAALTGGMTLDLTINPDFGQVEADPSEVNLTAYESYFSEQRPFFVEGENILYYPLGSSAADFTNESLFYSRRIGRKPQYLPNPSDGFYPDYIDQPDYSRILAAAKLSGRTKDGLSVGVLNAVTNEEQAVIREGGRNRNVTVEPLTNFFIGRLQKEFDNGNTAVGGIITAVNRKKEAAHLDFLASSAYSGGFDFKKQWQRKTYALNFKMMGSQVSGSREALARLQTSPARYYQRPDAGYLEIDTAKTSMSGHGGALSFCKQAGSWIWDAGGSWRSPGLELNDLGYIRNSDRIQYYARAGYRDFHPGRLFRSYSVFLDFYQSWNFGGDNLYKGGSVSVNTRFLNYWNLYLSVDRSGSAYSSSFLRGGPLTRYSGKIENWLIVSSDARKDWFVRFQSRNSFDDDGISNTHTFSPSFRYKFSPQFSLTINPSYTKNINNLQYLKKASFGSEDRFIFGRVKQKIFRTDFRLDISLTPRLSIQYFAQPFIASGSYSRFKRITDPRAEGADRYKNYTASELSFNKESDTYSIDESSTGIDDYKFYNPDFNYKEYLSNLVVRWEYRRGSALYFVWSEMYDNYDNPGSFRLTRDLQNLFNSYSNYVFQLRLSYWFSV